MTDLPTSVKNLLNRETFYIIGNIFYIASFVLSVFVLWNIRKLRNAYRLRARGPSLLRDRSRSASTISGFLNDYKNFIPQIAEELGRIVVKLRSMEGKL